MHSFEFGRARSSSPMNDIFAIPVLACVYASIVSPLLIFFTHAPSSIPGMMETRFENKIFWPAMAASSVRFGCAKSFSRW